MPATSTAVNAKDAAIFLDDDEGSLIDISGSANKVRFDFTQELGTYRVFQEDWTLRVAHGKDASFKVDVIFTTAADEGYALLRDWFYGDASSTARTLRIIAPRDASGSDQYEAEVLVASGSIPLDSAEGHPILCSFELMPSGAVMHETVS